MPQQEEAEVKRESSPLDDKVAGDHSLERTVSLTRRVLRVPKGEVLKKRKHR